jgi:integrase
MQRRPKGSGTIRRAGSGWAVVYGPRASPTYEGGFRTKAEAERRLVLLRAEAMNRRVGAAADPRLSPTLAELAGPWLERRKATHKAAAEDGYRWHKHLAPWVGHLQPDAVDHARIRAFAEAKLQEGLSSGTVRVCVAVLSSLYVDLQERGLARTNPGRNLPRSLARLIRPSHDPRTTPFLERLEDVRRVLLALDGSLQVGFALGAFAGLRPGEAFALRWPQADLQARRIHVRESVTGSTKDKDSRAVPILDSLRPLLQAWHLKTGGTGLLCPPLRCDGSKIDKGTRGAALREVLQRLDLQRPGLGWYECTRHTFASHWVMGGGTLEELKEILGHYSIVMTERYAHLRPDHFAAKAFGMLQVDLQPGGASIADLNAVRGETPPATTRKRKRKTGAAL